MNGVLYTFDEFRTNIEEDPNGFITQVCLNVNNRVPSPKEMEAMARSYPVVSEVLAAAIKTNAELANAHIGLASIKFEYKLPSAPAWCDLVILGDGGGRKQVVIIELKDWYPNTSDQPGMCEGLVFHKGVQYEHPSDQVRGYAEYCKNFHSAVLDEKAEVTGCAFFSQKVNLAPYCEAPNGELVSGYRIFNHDNYTGLADVIAGKIERGDEAWAIKFVNGYYRQNRNILMQVSKSFDANSEERPFVLLNEQRTGFYTVMHLLDEAVHNSDQKQVIIVSGPPGSGKSAIALNLWSEAVKRYVANEEGEHPGNVVFVATSSSQNENWGMIFERYSDFRAASGLVRRSNDFNPGMTGGSMKKEYLPVFRNIDAEKYLRNDTSLKYEYYEDYLDYMIKNNLTKGYKDNLHFLSIVDEAHALINPLSEGFSTNKPSGWCMQMGPQAYHVIRESRVSVFLMDGEQSFRDNETTTVSDIMSLAWKLGAATKVIDLSGLQFRCAGSAEYVEWVGGLFSKNPVRNTSLWRDLFDFRVFDSTKEMEAELRAKQKDGRTVRLLSSFSVPWISGKTLNEMHTGSEDDYDFDFENEDGTRFRRHWNNPKRYDIFIQATEYSLMHDDPLCEVGCPYVARGFDFDYTGVLWLDDVVWRNGMWMLNLKNCVDRANTSSHSQAVKEQIALAKKRGRKRVSGDNLGLVPFISDDQPFTNAFAKTVLQAYRILLTRAVRGVCLYVKDKETRDHIRELLG